MLFVLFLRGGNVDIGQRDFALMPWAHVVEIVSDDGVVADFELMTIFENQHGRVSFGFRCGLRRIGLRHSMRMRVGGVGHGRNIGLRSGAAAIENCGTALIVCVVGRFVGGIGRGTDWDTYCVNSAVEIASRLVSGNSCVSWTRGSSAG